MSCTPLTHPCVQFLCLESSFEGKDYVCQRLLHFLMGEASCGVTDKLSFQLMEALLYRVELNLFTGRVENALAILQVTHRQGNLGAGHTWPLPTKRSPCLFRTH